MPLRAPSLCVLALLIGSVPARAGAGADTLTPILPDVRRHLDDGRACLLEDPALARSHAMAVLVGREITVQIDLSDVPAKRQTACRVAVDDALAAWQDALSDIRLRRADDRETSGIVVRFRPDVRQKGEPVAGFVNWVRRVNKREGTVSGDVQVRFRNLNGSDLPPAAMRHIVIHEMGHLLGLDDTDHCGDAMGPLDVSRPVAGPTPNEALAVKSIRAEAQALLNDAVRR